MSFWLYTTVLPSYIHTKYPIANSVYVNLIILQAAQLLLSVGLTDSEDNVRRMALNKYTLHPHGGDIQAMLDRERG